MALGQEVKAGGLLGEILAGLSLLPNHEQPEIDATLEVSNAVTDLIE